MVILADLQAAMARFDVYIWVDNPNKALLGLNALNELIWKTLSDNGMEFAVNSLNVNLAAGGEQVLRSSLNAQSKGSG